MNSTPSTFARTVLLLFLAVLLLSAPQAALLPLLDRDEPRFAEASREMLESGNYVVPTFNHAPRYAKPPLIYWCQSLCFELLGENAFAARLPSLVATAGTAVLLLAWGTQLGGRNIGLIAGLSYAFCLQTMQQGRVATADALLIFFMTLTVWAGWQLLGLGREKKSSEVMLCWNFWGVILVLGFAGGFLAKGPEALLPIFPLLICARADGKRVLVSLVAMLLLSLLLVAGWAIPAFVMTHGDYWRVGLSEGVGERMVSGLQGHGAPSFGWYLLSLPLYLVIFWLSALPWSPLLIIQRKKLFPGWKPDLLDTYLLLNVGIIFLIFSLMVTKLPHYTLPAFPFIALLFARRWIKAELSPGLPIKLAAGFGLGFAIFTAVFIPVAMAHHGTPSPVGDLVRTAKFVSNQNGLLNFQPPGTLTPSTAFAVADFQEPNVIWEMRGLANELGQRIGYGETISDTKVFEFLNEDGPRAVVISTPAWDRINTKYYRALGPSVKTYEARGFNAAKGSFIDLTLVVKE